MPLTAMAKDTVMTPMATLFALDLLEDSSKRWSFCKDP